MRINRIETKAYPISQKAEENALKRFQKKARQVERDSKSKVTRKIEYHYTPLLVVSAVKYDRDGRGTLIEGLENKFHIGLKDAAFYVFTEKKTGTSVKERLLKSHDVNIKRIDLLLDVATLSTKALTTLGYLLDHGTMNFDKLDLPSKNAAKELSGRKYADIYRPLDKESDIKKVFRDILEFDAVTPIYKVKPILPIPRFTDKDYNLSEKLVLTDTVEEDLPLGKIAHAPEKIMYILGTMFNCALVINRIIYMPYIECTFQWAEKHSTEIRYIPCLKTSRPREFKQPRKLKTITIGTKGHGLEAIPFEDVALNFSNVAGMKQVKEKIKESIVYPLAHPELSKEFGSRGGGGVLFYGPPGCGKSYIMRATVGEAGVNFYSVSVQDIIGNDVAAAAKELDNIFTEARAGAPSIIFFDEIDALGGSRKSGKTGAENRLVNQFLTNMDGVGASNENVLIVGATNAPWDMDPALRRAGRFTTQILIPPPDLEARKTLLKIHTKGRPIAPDVDFDKLADLTDNYSSADITAIAEEAAKIPWRASVHGQEKRQITFKDFITTLNERDSTLLPWLRLAEKQLRESGESDAFPELSDYVFKRAGGIEMSEQPQIKFADVGGLEDVKEEIKNKILYPLSHPELSAEYGRTLGGGLLLYGPPGCGKTYIARATAGECAAAFFNVRITDLLSPEEGVTEKRLHSIFERASRNTPSIIFFDEIDALAGKRTSAGHGAERRLINQFLTEMDGFEKNEGVVVLAATNAPWDIDPALRRAGRFSDQIFLPPPDAKSREAVFSIHLQGRPLASDVNLQALSELTNGYSSADLKLIVDEAAKIPWKESMKTGEKRPISMTDFKTVVSERKPSIGPWTKQAEKQLRQSGEADAYPGLSEYVFKRAGGVDAVKKPELDFSKVAGMEDLKEQIRKNIVYPLTHPNLSEKYGRTVGGGILFYGPPGCGKTFIARATAGECAAAFFNVRITDILSAESGEAEKRLSAVFERASRNTPSIIFFDEIDALAARRGQAGPARTLVNQFLTEIDGFAQRDGVMIIASTNAPWDIDPALRRAGRFTNQIYIPPPDASTRERIFELHTRGKPLAPDVDFKKLAELTPQYSAADIKAIVDEASEIPWSEAISGKQERHISIHDFIGVISRRKSSLPAWFKLAVGQIEKSGEKESYPLLWAAVTDGASQHSQKETKPASGLDYEIGEINEQIGILKKKRGADEIDDETYHDLIKELEKDLIKLEAKKTG